MRCQVTLLLMGSEPVTLLLQKPSVADSLTVAEALRVSGADVAEQLILGSPISDGAFMVNDLGGYSSRSRQFETWS
ncbi:hypothetical protein GGD46_004405 [Rhizobium lusitanum]|uniref:Uncharacterized protein n=1 Tax=Rhizobium lusitanum TaxID=293958 RepID=A0A7X0MFH1_9HYPH|nr:hypothetical protein [Rhizobium lusitanum]